MKLKIILFSAAIFSFIIAASLFNYQQPKEIQKYPDESAWIKRTFPYYKADPGAYLDALSQHNQLLKKNLSKGTIEEEWQFAGPVNISGRIVDIEINPLDPNVIYAAAATGGIFKSTDAGINWTPIFDSLSTLTIGDIGIDPINPDIIYAGTGEPNGGHNNFPGAGIFKSIDAGSNWQYVGLDSTASIGRILIDPINPLVIYVAAVGSYFAPNPQRGVYKSTDGGMSWNKSLFVSDSTGAIDLVMDPGNSSILFASMWERVRRPNSSRLYGPSSGIYKSTNAGTTWNLLGPSTGLPNAGTTNIGRIGISQCKTVPNILYALYNDGANYTGMYKTTNYGANWTDADPGNQIADGTSNFSWYFGQVRVHPINPDIVFALDVLTMRTTNGGTTWSEIGNEIHVDYHALTFHPADPNRIWIGNDGGIFLSTNGGSNWNFSPELPITQFYEIGLDKTNPQRLYGGTQDNNTVRTNTGGLNDWESILGGDGFYVIVDPDVPTTIYAESQFGALRKSTNGGNSFSSAVSGINSSEPTNWSTPVVMDPNNRNILYYGTHKIYKTTNGAGSWTAASPKLTDWVSGARLGTLTTIAVAPSNSDYIYAGSDDSHVWVTTNGGGQWNDISSSLPERWVTRVVVDPRNENIIYVTYSGLKWRDPEPHVFKSTNTGQSWIDISGNLPDAPVNAFAVDNYNSSVLYLGSDIGVYRSVDAGGTWEVLGTGLPVIVIGDLKIHPINNYLAAGTYGRSMYKLQLTTSTSITGNDIPYLDFKLEQNFPNPFNPSTRIKYQVPKEGNVSLKVFDIQGKEVDILLNEDKPAGSYEIDFNGANLSSGVYIYQLKTGGYSTSKKMILLR